MDKELLDAYIEARVPLLRELQRWLDDLECPEEALMLERRITDLLKLLW